MMRLRRLTSVVVSVFVLANAEAAPQGRQPASTLNFTARIQKQDSTGAYRNAARRLDWDARKTAVVLCDMWDRHWCKGASRRVTDMAPRMNALVRELRKRGALIIHCPSGTLKHYQGSAALALAASAKKVNTEIPLQRWCKLDPKHESKLPIDDSDGGCDCQPRCKGGAVWRRQIASLEIAEGDAMSDSASAFYLMKQRGIENVVVMGVHTNMCVLGRPFGIRQMVMQGQNVVLVRDLTDTMYNSRSAPFADHHTGTDLVVEHIERHWCPTITSDQVLGGTPHRFADDQRKRLVIVMAEREYDTKNTLPAFAARHLKGYRVTQVHADPQNKNSLPGLEVALRDADVAIFSIRRRAPTAAQMKAIRKFLARGAALVGVRTTSHAFDTRGKVPEGHAAWPGFDRDVLGGNYQGHHSNRHGPDATLVWIDAKRSKHPILAGVPGGKTAIRSTLYRHLPLAETATALMFGRAGDAKPHQPVTWINTRADGGRVFYTSLGHVEDFRQEWFQRMLAQGIRWATESTPEPKKAPIKKAARAPGARSPTESHATLRTPRDLVVDLVLAEPTIEQPLFLNFDERGRMWVVQYRQYPHPAGIRITSRDRLWRNVYDRAPPPPPHSKDSPFRGADRITIHEDTNGDGKFDKTKVFLDGLNMCTSLAHGRGGVWVLNPPYLLFYKDGNRDDVPDGDGKPVVHLKGFWLEDSHSIANSLRWGPDGWLYGAQGSTVTADIVVVGKTETPIHTQGQQIWRYHPERRVFEVFAEGGGNAFGCEIDAKGRVFSGHNGGNTRGYHYPQGGYLRKGFNKHGPLSNPYAFGFFPHMPHHKVARFSHNFIVYEGDSLPDRFQGKIFAIDPMNHYVPIAERIVEGSTFRTKDIDAAIRTEDKWFRPVDIKHGPDGAIYLCDWYEAQINHYRNHEGKIDKRRGRIYRIRGVDYKPAQPFDLARLTNRQLVGLHSHKNRWHREQARRLLADRGEDAVSSIEDKDIAELNGALALEHLWMLSIAGQLEYRTALAAMRHKDPHVRAWAVRLLSDTDHRSRGLEMDMVTQAIDELHPVVLSQFAASAKRLPTELCLAIFIALTNRDVDLEDRYIPLQLWWALESKCATDADEIVEEFASPSTWQRPIVRKHILWRLMRRFAATGKRLDLLRCARLLNLAPDKTARRHLMDGFDQAFKGRAMDGLPPELIKAIENSGIRSLAVDLRRRKPGAVDEALKILADARQALTRRSTYAYLLAELQERRAIPTMLAALGKNDRDGTGSIMLRALQAFDDPSIGKAVLELYPGLPESSAEVARVLLAARASWSRQLIDAVDAGKIDAKTFATEEVSRLRLHHDAQLLAGIDRIWGELRKPTPAHLRGEIARIKAVVMNGEGDPYRGKKLFLSRCAACHRLFADGADIGPDLTSFKRDDLDSMLLAIVNPNAEIREGYQRLLVAMKDGRIVLGSKADEDDLVLVLRGIDGRSSPLPKARISKVEPVPGSLMPGGLLHGLSDPQLRALFAYLRTTQPQIK